ncbi:MAG: tetratricopeptide repeat protein [Bradymonadia bacterium]
MPRLTGREADLERLLAHLQPAGTWLTLMGPPGVGKTTLAQALGERRPHHWLDGRRCEDLAQLCKQMTAALGTLGHEEHPLLIVDDVTHLASEMHTAPGPLGSLVAHGRVLVTSEIRLQLPGEHIYELSPLSIAGDDPSGRALFVTCAAHCLGQFSPDAGQVEHIDAIVSHLDGLPLAIERGAARMRLMAPQALSAIVDPHRHGGRKGLIDDVLLELWGHLTEADHAHLTALSAFDGSFHAEAGAALLEALGCADGYDALQRLRDHSMLDLQHQAAQATLVMLHVIRGFVRRTGPREMLQRARTARARTIIGASSATPDLQRAVQWAIDAGNLILAAQGLLALESEIVARGISTLELEHMAQCVDAGALPPELEAGLLRARGNALRCRGDLEAAVESLTRAVETAPEASTVMARARLELGIALHESGDLEGAAQCYDEARQRFERFNELQAVGQVLGSIAVLAHERGEIEEAEEAYERALALFRRARDPRSEAAFLINLGDLHKELGRSAAARRHFEDAQVIAHRHGEARIAAVALGNLGGVSQELGLFDEALAAREAAARALEAVGDERLATIFQGYAGAVHHQRGALTEAMATYHHVMPTLQKAGDQRFGAIFSMYLGAAAAARGDVKGAREAFRSAADALSVLEDPTLHHALRLHRLHLGALETPKGREEARRWLSAHPFDGHSDEIRFALTLLQLRLTEAQSAPQTLEAPALIIHRGGNWLQKPDGEVVDLRRRKAMRLMLAALVDQSARDREAGLDVYDLFEAGWPGEKATPEAATNRVYVNITALRKLGLRGVLVHHDNGYLLDPTLSIAWSEAATPPG